MIGFGKIQGDRSVNLGLADGFGLTRSCRLPELVWQSAGFVYRVACCVICRIVRGDSIGLLRGDSLVKFGVIDVAIAVGLQLNDINKSPIPIQVFNCVEMTSMNVLREGFI